MPLARPRRASSLVLSVAALTLAAPSVASEPAPASAGDRARESPVVYRVEHDLRPAAARRLLSAAGADVVGLDADGAWLVRVPPSRARGLARLPGVTGLTARGPLDALSPDLRQQLAQPSEGLGGEHATLEVEFVDEVEGAAVESRRLALAALAPDGLVRLGEQGRTAALRVAPEARAALSWAIAERADVLRVELTEAPELHLDPTIGWVQSGDPGLDLDRTAPLFRNGLTGRGLAIALADTGIQNDACRITYGVDPNEAAWAFDPTGGTGVLAEGGPLPPWPDAPPLRTRARKVIAEHVLDGATHGPWPEWAHGQWLATIAVGDRDVLAARPLVRDLGRLQNVRPFDPAGDWVVGEELRPDLAPVVDDPATSEAAFPTDFGSFVQHHQQGDGIAPGAQLVDQDLGGDDTFVTGAFDPVSLLEQAHAEGATTWIGAFGSGPCIGPECYTIRARAADHVTWKYRDFVMVTSIGNDGALGSPSVSAGYGMAKNVLSMGATDPADRLSEEGWPGEDVAPYSSQGPTATGRLAPDLVVPGTVRTFHQERGPIEDGTGSGDFQCDELVDVANGTSASTAIGGGLSALVQQYFRDGYYPSGVPVASDALRPTNALVRAVLVNSARSMRGAGTGPDGSAPRPNVAQGWGGPSLGDTLFFAGDPLLPTERGALTVLNDVPNGVEADATLTEEPGGALRSALVSDYRPAILDGQVHDFTLEVPNADSTDAANELRITLAWSDVMGPYDAVGVVNDLDLEVISPGPDGVLDTSGASLAGDDVVYRSGVDGAWEAGFTRPASEQVIQAPPFSDFSERDALNTIENVFVPAADVVAGSWRVRVVGYSVPGDGTTSDDGRPNFVLGDGPAVHDLDGDGVAETDAVDVLDSSRQGYALIASHGAGSTSPVTVPIRRWTPLDPRNPGRPDPTHGELRR